METKTYRFVKNILWPFKSTLEISNEGITNRGKLVKWNDMASCSSFIQSINGSMNYNIIYKDKTGKRHQIIFVVALTGSKKKKELFAEIYSTLMNGFNEKLIAPRVIEIQNEINSGGAPALKDCSFNMKGIELAKGLIVKDKIFIPWNEVVIHGPDNGAFTIASTNDSKLKASISYMTNEDALYIEATLRKMALMN